jgi:hypothetical protein
MPGNRNGPGWTPRAASDNNNGEHSLAELKARADLMLRCAWLTVDAERMYNVDEGGLLSAQLLDLRDLLQACEQRGCWK